MGKERIWIQAGSSVRRIISGGQTGADRGALAAALSLGLETGGWAPKDWRAEDGQIPERFRSQMRESMSADYADRTARNVAEADATVVFTKGHPGTGSALTLKLAGDLGKPAVWIDTTIGVSAIGRLGNFLEHWKPVVLNVGGTRGTHAPDIYDFVRDTLVCALWREGQPRPLREVECALLRFIRENGDSEVGEISAYLAEEDENGEGTSRDMLYSLHARGFLERWTVPRRGRSQVMYRVSEEGCAVLGTFAAKT